MADGLSPSHWKLREHESEPYCFHFRLEGGDKKKRWGKKKQKHNEYENDWKNFTKWAGISA